MPSTAPEIRWIIAFVDRPRPAFAASARFWCAVTDSRLSAPRGEADEFATFLPSSGQACLKIQGVIEGGGAHLDFDVEDVARATEHALSVGARLERRDDPGLSVLRSPAGQPFCLTAWQGQSERPPVVEAPAGVRSRVDQVCLDLGPLEFEAECAFWSALTGWDVLEGRSREFARLDVPARLPIRILLQRRDTEGPARAHLDISCTDISALRAWHEQLGASRAGDGRHWSVMRDPAGALYCITPRDPATGLVVTS